MSDTFTVSDPLNPGQSLTLTAVSAGTPGAVAYPGSPTGYAVNQNFLNSVAAGGPPTTTAQYEQYATGAGPGTTGTQAQQDALATLTTELNQWGLGNLSSWAWSEITSGKSPDQILIDLRNTPEYKTSIFGQANTARQAAGLPVLSEADILAYKNTLLGYATQAGMPQGFLSDSELASLLGHDVSAVEASQRITQGFATAAIAVNAVPQIGQALQDYYGVTPGGLAAYWLDPTKALNLLQNQYQAATVGGMASSTGWGGLDRATAEQLAALGITQDQARQGFGQLAHMAQAYSPLPGEQPGGPTTVSHATQVAGEFEGNAAAQQALALAAATRQAAFAGGANYTGNSSGAQGLGAAVPNR